MRIDFLPISDYYFLAADLGGGHGPGFLLLLGLSSVISGSTYSLSIGLIGDSSSSISILLFLGCSTMIFS